MNKDEIKGKAKDVAGRVERQVGEWTGDSEKQAHGTAKQAEGKVQNAWGKVKDAAKDATNDTRDQNDADVEEQRRINSEKKAS
ncbi:MAG TPA: CsbD family protein [Candidatus Deferrimicrobiaceae bacterium]|nr:CsbD family protein [Candidatus Deferrimicrobiaceae bacterium]